MNNIQKIIETVGTDCSTKWLSTSDVPKLVELVVGDALQYVTNQNERDQILKHFEVSGK